ncbi:hypothetical protein SOM61_08605 [Massilia sp. CFBP9012]|uniref:hypothetical protein n=1 Tax=Massilia sp. CFBP9012 TaxID=3096531 RepID=UPI002A6A8BED|nr:hypothetical protein [Massilia sp. CFBP9012]MDY0975021.1 hypothetical protein [Massilia sp. CFBP9012]
MTVATARIARGPYRVLRRLARKLTKPLRLAVIRHQLALSEGNVRHLELARVEAVAMLQAEHMRQVKLMQRRQQIEQGFA